jgi:hypothetical protein
VTSEFADTDPSDVTIRRPTVPGFTDAANLALPNTLPTVGPGVRCQLI